MRRAWWIACLGILLLAAAGSSRAGSGLWAIDWYTLDAGAGTQSAGDVFTLSGSVGQPEVGAASGDTYGVRGGFWGSAAPESSSMLRLYLPAVLRG
jgi:hypothetical protein